MRSVKNILQKCFIILGINDDVFFGGANDFFSIEIGRSTKFCIGNVMKVKKKF